jgi:hypothetical protein
MLLGYLTLLTALILSLSAAVYSILGLTAIFAAAFWSIVILGGSLEVGKIVTVLWLHKYWKQAELQYKLYLCSAVIILMVLTSMGVFGYLSKAHLDQAVPSGDIQAQVQIFDDKIQTQKDNIKAARAALTQMDSAVDQTMGRTTDEKGADKAAALRRSQGRERTALQNDISKAQTEIVKLQEARGPIASQARKVEAEVGPIKYIAALVYGDNPDANVLEKAVRWVIILIVIVFDPLALTLLLAATKTFEWERGIDLFNARKKDEPEYEQDDGPLTDEEIEQIRELARNDLPTGEVITKEDLFPEPKNKRFESPGWMFNPVKKIKTIFDNENTIEDHDNESGDSQTIIAQRAWKVENPADTLKNQRQLLRKGLIDHLPWEEPRFLNTVVPGTELQPDNELAGAQGEVKGFGSQFPNHAVKGDMFLRVDQLPSILYKYNGSTWIEVDKHHSDNYAYDDAYIDYLITKISSGEYDPELLSEAEQTHIESRLKHNPFKV